MRKVDRDEVFLELTRSICPVCKRVIEAEINARDNCQVCFADSGPDVMKLVAAQVPEWFRLEGFVPVPGCFPTCRSMSYAFVDGDTVVPFTRLLEIDDYLDYLSNRVIPDYDIRHALERMFSSSKEQTT